MSTTLGICLHLINIWIEDRLLQHSGNLKKTLIFFHLFKSHGFHLAILEVMSCQPFNSPKSILINFLSDDFMWGACRDLFTAWGLFKELLLFHLSSTLYLDLAGPGQTLIGNVTVIFLCWTHFFRSFCFHLTNF